ncbi:MAG: TonB family protein [Pseudooceanicola sp.]
MIASSRSAKLAAILIAAGAHAALALALTREAPIMVEAGAGAQDVRLGSSFADMAAGTLSAETVDRDSERIETRDPVEKAAPEETLRPSERPEAREALTPERPETIARTVPETETPPPVEPLATAPAPVTEAPVERAAVPDLADGLLPVQPETSESPTPDRIAGAEATAAPDTPPEAEPATEQPAEAQTAPAEIAAAPAVRPERLETSEPEAAETLESTPPETAAVTRSKRPRQRSAEFEAEHKPPEPEPAPRRSASGNSDRDATAGASTGREAASVTRQGTRTGTAAEAGNAAASNYPGLVYRTISRVRKPRLNRRGTTRVAFSISASGGLAGVSVAGSSGSSNLDEAALTLVRRAAPFPAPPAGAQRSFVIPIQFR